MNTEREDERFSKFWGVVTDMDKILSEANLLDKSRKSSDILSKYSINIPINDIPTENQLIIIKTSLNGLNYEIIDSNEIWLKIIG